MSLANVEQALKLKVKTNPSTALPEAYKIFLNVFSYEEANKLPPHCPGVDHTIYMQPGTQPSDGLLYSISKNELQVFKKFLDDNIKKKFI